MDQAGPFETAPMLAVAVSGGADSMALCLLADRWARARGGRVAALSVDHRLRPESAAEARQVARWMRALGIEHEVLPWRGDRPASGIAARARAARYRLLAERCLERGLLHLLVGHHRADQAETVVLRTSRGSGRDGLAAMSAVVETGAVRIVRPLLAVPPARLRAYLEARRQPWLEDPSNIDLKYTRNRIRRALSDPVGPAQAPEEPAEAASSRGAEREERSFAVATLLARCCRLDPAGFARLEARVLLVAPAWTASAALGRLLTTIGGGNWPPAGEKLERLRQRLSHPGSLGGTLGRCRYWWESRATHGGGYGGAAAGGQVLVISREARGLPLPVELERATTLLDGAAWDGRFAIEVASRRSGHPGLWLGPLGDDGWREALGIEPALRRGRIPYPAAVTMPALRDAAGLLAVPLLGVGRERARLGAEPGVRVSFRPRRSLSKASYFLA